jgi:hypothetical protein
MVPLRALAGEKSICAFEYDESAWTELKRTYKAHDLQMPCCHSPAIPKTSKLKSFFFSHASRGECTSAPESTEHIYLKTLIAKAAKRAGWSVFTEWPGQTPSGEKWVSDVFCEQGKSQIAFEVQLSYQSLQELIARQHAYKASGVRAAWFASAQKFKEGYIRPSKEVPFFYILPFILGTEPYLRGFDVSLAEFVIGMLAKKLSWKSEPWVYYIHYLKDTCWSCNKEVKQVFGRAIDVYGESAKTIPNMSTVLGGFAEFITNGELKDLGLNIIGRFDKLKGNAPGFPYCNVCIHCGAPQNNYYVMRKLEERGVSDDEFESDSPEIGFQEFVSVRESSGSWCYEK